MNIIRSLRSGDSGYPEDARGLAGQALESTRDIAGTALERAGERMRDLRYGVKDMANRGANSMGDYAQATTRYVSGYVSEQPVRSALIAAALGAAVMGLVLALRRNRRYY